MLPATTQSSTDEQLASRGDVVTLYDRHASALLVFLQRLMPAGVGAEDVAQQVWLQVHAKLRQGGTFEGNFRAWLFQIARNARIDPLRRRRPESLAEGSDYEARDRSPLAELVGREFESRLKTCLGQLSPRRAHLIQRRAAGDKPADISSDLDVPVATISKELFVARRLLETCLGLQGEEP